MGVFSMASPYESNAYENVEMNEAYTTGVDMAIALAECRQNEFAVLQAGIKQDMIAAVTEDYEERIAINEATASDLISKTKEILKKLLEKIKSIFHSFMAKLNSFFMDSEEMFKKYSGEIAKKNFSDFKLKVREFKRSKFNDLIATTTVRFWLDKRIDISTDDKLHDAMESDKLNEAALKRVFTDAALKAMSIDDDLGNMEKEIEDYCFEESETKDDFTSSTIITADWIGGLLNTKKFIENIEKTNKSTERLIAKAIATIDKDIKKISGLIGKKDTAAYATHVNVVTRPADGEKAKYNSRETKRAEGIVAQNANDSAKIKMLRGATLAQAQASRFQTVQVKAQNARLSCAKKAMAQAKKIFAAAVAYNPKKENYDLYMAIAESEEFDAVMAME